MGAITVAPVLFYARILINSFKSFIFARIYVKINKITNFLLAEER